MSTRPISPGSLLTRWPWPWPMPALLAWTTGWASWTAAGAAGAAPATSLLVGLLAAALPALCCHGRWRRLIALAGFPLTVLVLGFGDALPPWAWLAAAMPLLLAYPVRAWRDAPFFPTPAGALQGLEQWIDPPRRALDAGCGLGHGLAALHGLWPRCELHGVEWSLPLASAAAWRCRYARVRRGDLWAMSWVGHDLVYVFQRPESMNRVFDKARRELAAGGWLVSLEFEVPGQTPVACLRAAGRRPLWIYQPLPAKQGSTTAARGR